MADHMAPEVLARLATLETHLAAQEAVNREQGAEPARHRRRRHGLSARRLVPLLLAAPLVALAPLATLPAKPSPT